MNHNVQEIYFNLHGKVTLQISTSNQNILEFFNRSLWRYKTNEKPASSSYVIRDYSCFQLPSLFYYVNKDHIVFENGFCLTNEEYAILATDECIIEYTNTKYKPTHFWLQYLLVQRNLCIIHGAGIELNGKGIIFPSFSGGGKTTLISSLRNLNGFRFFSDEFIITDMDGTMFSYPCNFTIYEHHLDLFHEIQTSKYHNYFRKQKKLMQAFKTFEKIPVPSKLQKVKKFTIDSLSRFLAGPPHLKVPVTEFIPLEKIGIETKLDVALFLTRYSGKSIRFLELEKNLFIEKTVRMLSLVFSEKLVYLVFLSTCGIMTLSSYEQKQKMILSQSLSGVKTFEVLVPYNMNPKLFSESVVQFINTLE